MSTSWPSMLNCTMKKKQVRKKRKLRENSKFKRRKPTKSRKLMTRIPRRLWLQLPSKRRRKQRLEKRKRKRSWLRASLLRLRRPVRAVIKRQAGMMISLVRGVKCARMELNAALTQASSQLKMRTKTARPSPASSRPRSQEISSLFRKPPRSRNLRLAMCQ